MSPFVCHGIARTPYFVSLTHREVPTSVLCHLRYKNGSYNGIEDEILQNVYPRRRNWFGKLGVAHSHFLKPEKDYPQLFSRERAQIEP